MSVRDEYLNRRNMLKKSLKWGAGLAAAMGILAGAVYGLGREILGWTRSRAPRWEFPLDRPINCAHRGGDALFPENTLEAFLASAERFGCPMMELDVHVSSDGVPMVIHDPTVQRTTGGAGAVKDLTLSELKALDAAAHFSPGEGMPAEAWSGLRIPTLEEVLRALPEHYFSVDLKQSDPPREAEVVEVVRKTGMEGKVLLGSEEHKVFLRIQSMAPEIPSFFTMRSAIVFVLSVWLGLGGWYRPPHNALLIPRRFGPLTVVTPRLVRAARRLGLPVLIWTIDDAEEMRDLLKMGVDGLVTGRPDLMANIISDAPTRS